MERERERQTYANTELSNSSSEMSPGDSRATFLVLLLSVCFPFRLCLPLKKDQQELNILTLEQVTVPFLMLRKTD